MNSSQDGTINLEKLAMKHYQPDEILRIDRPTTGDPEHPAFYLTGAKIGDLIRARLYNTIYVTKG
ncbi:MAG: hypothetical protein ACRC2S_00150 [Waterburya sp.]